MALTLLGVIGMVPAESAVAQSATEGGDARKLIDRFERELRPLEIASNRAWWDANTSGKDEDFARKEAAQNALDTALADRGWFAEIQRVRQNPPDDPRLKRQVELLYLRSAGKQVSPELLAQISAEANLIEKAFNVYRGQLAGRSLTDSQIRETLKSSRDSAELQSVWQASKGIGREVAIRLNRLVKLRNQSAKELGFRDYHDMMLRLNEQSPEQIEAIFDELDELTREPFLAIKREIDARLAERYGVSPEDLRPWHYHDPFFQEPPAVFDFDLDAVFTATDVVDVTRRFYTGIGLPIDEILKQSDLFERPGKSPHAFCTDIDREGDVRVLANVVPNLYWMATMLHEMGHGVYSSQYIPSELPYLLRSDAHILATEGLAMMFERFCGSSDWLKAMGVPVSDPAAYDAAAQQARRAKLLIFSRWCQVMFRFERAMYAHPDQDLNRLWWDLVEKYQGLRRPENRSEPDYASKIHVVSAPCYYHNYMLGELFACQLHERIARDVLKSSTPHTAIYTDDPRVGEFLRQGLFALGCTAPWDEIVEHSTGAPLNARAFAAELSTAP
jgi:peptidyl-dipeptidase A